MPTFPVGDASYRAVARRFAEEKAERVHRDAVRMAPRREVRVIPDRFKAGWLDPDTGPDVADDDAFEYVEVMAMEYLEPIARFPTRARGGIIPDPPKSCDCGHLYSVHDSTPGVGCTHRPYCLCVHPTGQQVPVTRPELLPIAPPIAPPVKLGPSRRNWNYAQ